MTTEAYVKTNQVWQKIELILKTENGSYGLHTTVRTLLEAVKDEREKTAQEIATLTHECMIKGFYIKQLEKLKGVNNNPNLERVERDLINILNHTTDTLARVTEMRGRHDL
jgi:hypothetical protein